MQLCLLPKNDSWLIDHMRGQSECGVMLHHTSSDKVCILPWGPATGKLKRNLEGCNRALSHVDAAPQGESPSDSGSHARAHGKAAPDKDMPGVMVFPCSFPFPFLQQGTQRRKEPERKWRRKTLLHLLSWPAVQAERLAYLGVALQGSAQQLTQGQVAFGKVSSDDPEPPGTEELTRHLQAS